MRRDSGRCRGGLRKALAAAEPAAEVSRGPMLYVSITDAAPVVQALGGASHTDLARLALPRAPLGLAPV